MEHASTGASDLNADSFVCTNGLLHDDRARGARVASAIMTLLSNVTVGIDIGTSSVKAIAADDDGNVVARARIPHDFSRAEPAAIRARRRRSRGTRARNARSRRSAT